MNLYLLLQKGTQSLNPHNDYSQNFVDTGQRPQNFISKCTLFSLKKLYYSVFL